MALATRLGRVLTATLLACGPAWSSDPGVPGNYNPSPSAYSLSYDKNQWMDEFSVFHMAVADQRGVFVSSIAASDDARLRSLTRLDSSWSLAPTVGFPIRVGDGVSSAGLWDQPARIGGIQIGNFQPALPAIMAPPSPLGLLEVAGPATSATTRFMDHLRTLMQLQNQPLVAAGQSNYSLEWGRLRENFEVRSGDYGPWIASGTYRYGIDAATTVDGEVAQRAGQQSFVGLGIMEGMGSSGLISAKLASSRDLDSSGWLARMGYDYSHDCVSVAVRSHIQSSGYQAVGDSSSIESFRHRTLATAGVDLGSLGKISLATATQTYADDTRRDIVALSHAMPFGGGGVVSTAAAYSPGQLGNATVLLSFTYPFDYLETRAHKTGNTANSALDRTIVDAFGQARLPAPARSSTERSVQ